MIKQEAGDEEKKEVSNALKKLRFKYDAIHKMVVEKTNQLDLIKVKLPLSLFMQILERSREDRLRRTQS